MSVSFGFVPLLFLLTPLSLSLSVFSSLFALLSKKHNKVLEQATQSLRGRQGDNAALPDYVSNPHGLFFLSLNNVYVATDFSREERSHLMDVTVKR